MKGSFRKRFEEGIASEASASAYMRNPFREPCAALLRRGKNQHFESDISSRILLSNAGVLENRSGVDAGYKQVFPCSHHTQYGGLTCPVATENGYDGFGGGAPCVVGLLPFSVRHWGGEGLGGGGCGGGGGAGGGRNDDVTFG